MEKVKELAIDNLLLSAKILVEDCKQLKASLALELAAARDDRKTMWKEFQELVAELEKTLAQIQARNRLDATVLGLIRPEDTRKQRQKKKKRSDQQEPRDDETRSINVRLIK